MRRQERIPPDVALARLAGRQWGVVSRAQLRGLGLGRGAIDGRLRTGRLRRVHHAVLSHITAAVHWNLLNYDAPRPEVTAPASRRGVPGIRLHRSHSLDAQDTPNHQGIPTTTVHRTLLDIAAQAPEHHLERALAQAERLKLYDHAAIRSD